MSFKLTCDLDLNQFSNQQLINLQNQLTRVITKRLIKQEPEPIKVTVNFSVKRTDHLANREKRLHDALVNRQKRLANREKRLANREKRLASLRQSNNGSPSPRRNNGSPSPRRNNGSPSPRDLSPPRRRGRNLSREGPHEGTDSPRDMFRPRDLSREGTKCANAAQMKRKIRFRTDSDSDSDSLPPQPQLDFEDDRLESQPQSYVDCTLDEIIAKTQDLFESECESDDDEEPQPQPQPTKQQLDQELDEIVRQREDYFERSWGSS